MKDKDKTKEQLIDELKEIRERICVLQKPDPAEGQYREIVELSPDGIITVNLKGTITSCNQAFTYLAGFSKEEIVGKHFTKLPTLRAKDIPKYVKLFASMLTGKDISPY